MDEAQIGKVTQNPIMQGSISKYCKNTAGWLKANLRVLGIAALIYLVISLINFWPLTTNITTTVAGTGGDIYQMLWHIWFVGNSIFSAHQSIWSTNLVFWPVGANLIYETMIPIASALAYPFSAISLEFSYNLIFFFGFVLSGIGMFILADYITENRYAAFFAGLVFTFSAFHIAQAYGHLEYANLEWVPLAIYFFLRMIRENDKYLNAFGVSACMVLTMFMGDIEQAIMVFIAMLIIALWYAIGKESRVKIINRQFILSVAAFFVITFLIGIWAFIPILQGILAPGGLSTANALNDVQHNMLWSADLFSFFLPGYDNGIFHNISLSYIDIYHGNVGETSTYIGYSVIALALLGLYKDWRKHAMWIAIAAIFLILALGPIIQIGGVSTGVPSLYYLLKYIPVVEIIREPGRFDLIATLALSILAAFGVKELHGRIASAKESDLRLKRIGAICLISLLFLIENNGMPLSASFASQITTTVQPIPSFYSELGSISGNFSVLQLPIIINQTMPELYPGIAEFYTTAMDKPIIGGYTTRENTTQEDSVYNIPLAQQATNLESGLGFYYYPSPVNENYTNETLLTLYNYRTAFVSVAKSAYNQNELSELESYLYTVFGTPVYNDNTTIAFSATSAINVSKFRSFVAYPDFNQWETGSVQAANGSTETVWVPYGNGDIIVYAPYANVSKGSSINALINSYQTHTVPTAIRFRASSIQTPTATLYVAVGTSSGAKPIAEFNVTLANNLYQLNTTLISGPDGNVLYFIAQYNGAFTPVSVENITFSMR
jgi:hypothetical protein